MKEMECPVCGNRAVWVWSMHCCPQCGWNVKRARKTIQQLKLAPYVWMGFASLIFVGLMLKQGAGSLSRLALICGALAAIGFLLLGKLRRARAVLPDNSGEVSISIVAAAVLRLQSEWEWLLKTSPPREFRLTGKGRRNLGRSIFSVLCVNVIFALTIAGNYWLLHKQHGPHAGKLMRPLLVYNIVVLSIYTVFVSGFLIFYHRKARRLLTGGQAVIGKIVSFERTSSGSLLNVEFFHPLGKVAKARGSGRSEAYFEGMTLLVFFNPLKLKDSFVLLMGGDYEVIRPGLSNPSS
jgi:hypothetical protein